MYKNLIDKVRYAEVWAKENREERRKYCRKYYLEHQEDLKAKSRSYRIKNTGDINLRRRKRYADVGKAIKARYEEENRETINRYARQYRKDKPEFDRRHQSLRRKLEPISFYLNSWFEGSRLHHMGGQVGMFIPEPLHRSVWHSLLKNYGMDEINRRSLEWMQNSKR